MINIAKYLLLTAAAWLMFCIPAMGAQQVVNPQPGSGTAGQGEEVSFDVYYTVSDNNASLTGLGLRMHWDAGVLDFQGLSQVYSSSLFVQGELESDSQNLDADTRTNTLINISWVDTSSQWPPSSLPVKLFRATFSVLSPTDTQVNFSASSTAATYSLDASSFSVIHQAASTRTIRLTGDLSFGSVTVGQSATRTLTIHNDGNSTLNVTGISYPSGFSRNWSGNISAGASRNVTVTFSPTEARSYSGTITVNSDKTGGTDTIGCSGTGVALAYGSLRVYIEPADARNAGAQWRRVGTNTWRSSGTTESNVPAGTQRVEFSNIDGWRKPSSQSVTIREGQTTVIEQAYTEQQGTALPGVMMLLLDDE